jgi:type IV secretion system protein VirB6
MNSVIGALFGKVDALGLSAVQAIYNQLATQLQPVFLLGMAIYVVFWGYEMLIGRVGVSAPVFLWRIGRMMLIYSLAVSWGDFSVLIAEVLTKAPDGLANVVCQAVGGGANCGNGGGSLATGLSNLWNAANSAAQKISAGASWSNIGMTLLSYIVLLVPLQPSWSSWGKSRCLCCSALLLFSSPVRCFRSRTVSSMAGFNPARNMRSFR